MRELYPKEIHRMARAWYALSVKHQHERAVESALAHKGFEALAPFSPMRRQWSDRVKHLNSPLFPGYVFCHFDIQQKLDVLDTPGISRIVSFGGQPAEISAGEISAIRAVVASRLPIRRWPALKVGDRVRIERGPLKGIEGTLVKEKQSTNLVIGIDLLQRFIAVELYPACVMPVSGEKRMETYSIAAV